MRISAGCRIVYDCPQPTPMLLMLNVHPSRTPDLDGPPQIAGGNPSLVELPVTADLRSAPTSQSQSRAPAAGPASSRRLPRISTTQRRPW